MTTAAPPKRKCVTDVLPEGLASIPEDKWFEEAPFADYVYAQPVKDIANALIEGQMPWVARARVLYLWKRRGGASKGSATLGKCVRMSGLNGYLAQADFAIWVAADHCRTNRLTNWQFEALIHHELLHIDHGESGWLIRGHEVEAFNAEVQTYGLWKPDIRAIAQSIQPHLLELEPEA